MSNTSVSVSTRAPRLTIGIPVYNGEKYLRATLDSLLAQTFTDFELIVSDNASTDGTQEICREFERRDPRFRYVRNTRNIGPAANYNVSMDLARSELFKWCAADDIYGPNCLQRCIDALDADPQAVAAYARTKIIDDAGEFLRDYTCELNLSSLLACKRLATLINVSHRRHGAHEIWSVVRLPNLRLAGHKQPLVRADSVVLARLALLGKLVRVDEFHFFNRDHAKRSSRYMGRREVRAGSKLSGWIGGGPLPSAEWWDESLKGKINFPEWRVMREYYRAVAEIPISIFERVACHIVLGVFVVEHVPKLLRDLLIAGEQYVRRSIHRAEESGAETPMVTR